MLVEKDFLEFLKLLNRHRVDYCIIGAYAVGFYGVPRYTKDMDILIKPSIENGRKMVKVLKDFGFTKVKLTPKDFVKKGNIIQLGYEPIRIDIVNTINGCNQKDVWKNRVIGKYGNQRVYFIGLTELLKNKEYSKRQIDLVDIEKLRRIAEITKHKKVRQ